MKRPKVFILENVKGITTLHRGKYLRTIIKSLRSIVDALGNPIYTIHHQVMNTKEHGLPQSRPRWYCVGVSKDVEAEATRFEFPKPIPCPPIDELLDGVGQPRSKNPAQLQSLSETVRQNIQKAYMRINQEEMHSDKSHGSSKSQSTYVVDCDASKSRSSFMKEQSPCLTRSRFNGHWVSSRNRRMNVHEMMRLQGVDPQTFVYDISDQEIGRQLGNAMSVNVIERLLHSIFSSTNTLPQSEETVDRWKTGQALRHLQSSIDVSFKHTRPMGKVSGRVLSSHGIREYLLDSGATYHLVGRSYLAAEETR